MSAILITAIGITVGAPFALLLALGVAGLGGWLGERGVTALTRAALFAAFGGALTALVAFLASGQAAFALALGRWFGTSEASFQVVLAIDALSLGFAALSHLICALAAAFSFRYLHREPGYRRYFFQMALFAVGITLVALAGSIEVLFVGWELLGLSSALLIGFFQERRGPAQNALRVFAVYRLGDAAMLSAAVLVHVWTGSGSTSGLWAADPAHVAMGSAQAHVIGGVLILAVACKSALWPFSGWLPRAMEGPTPSSAVFYGALSIHAGCFLLLRAQPLLLASGVSTALMILGGAATTAYAALVGRVQTDIKSAIAFATLAQVGIIVVEIALGLQVIPMLHIAGHACFRLMQLLGAPGALPGLLEREVRAGATEAGARRQGAEPSMGVYLFAMERGFADALLEAVFVRPFRAIAAKLDALDRLLVADRSRRRK